MTNTTTHANGVVIHGQTAYVWEGERRSHVVSHPFAVGDVVRIGKGRTDYRVTMRLNQGVLLAAVADPKPGRKRAEKHVAHGDLADLRVMTGGVDTVESVCHTGDMTKTTTAAAEAKHLLATLDLTAEPRGTYRARLEALAADPSQVDTRTEAQLAALVATLRHLEGMVRVDRANAAASKARAQIGRPNPAKFRRSYGSRFGRA